jgi:RimJ/RimL family protein N-acetyltransferase
MNITFSPLAESHFPLLLKWLETPHVKAWWSVDQNSQRVGEVKQKEEEAKWTSSLIQEKYINYVKGFKLENGVNKPIQAYIIFVDTIPIGYIQIYNAYAFPRSKPLIGLPLDLAAFDVLIGEEGYLKRGIGSMAIMQFLKEYGGKYTHIFVDPETTNLAAIHAYEKAGFKKINQQPESDEVWMLRENCTKIIYLIGKPGTGKYTIAKELAKFGHIVCDNQLINNPIFSLLNYNGYQNTPIPLFGWNAIAKIRKAVFDFISMERYQDYVLTNCLYEEEGDRECYAQVEAMALKRGSLFVPVKLLISKEENIRRITQPSRRERWKSIDPQDADKEPLISIKHPNILELDVSNLSAIQSADRILEHVHHLPFNLEKKHE